MRQQQNAVPLKTNILRFLLTVAMSLQKILILLSLGSLLEWENTDLNDQ